MALKTQAETASSIAKRQQEISVAEFFSKNRHLLGFDNPTKALLTAIREAVDNALDACEEAHILPSITVELVKLSEKKYKVTIEDNGPGIVKKQLPSIFGKLLYGSKFHRLKQSRGQQGIGISAAVMYGHMTTGKPAEIISKVGHKKPLHSLHLQIDTKKNTPKVLKDNIFKDDHWEHKQSGTSISITLEALHKEGKRGVLSYLTQTSLANSHCEIIYKDPKNKTHHFPRLINQLPKSPVEIKPHPHGIELGNFIHLINNAKRKNLQSILVDSFCRLSQNITKDILKSLKIPLNRSCSSLSRDEIEKLYSTIQETKLLPPPTNCLSAMQENSINKGLYWLFTQSKSDHDLNNIKTDPAPQQEKDDINKQGSFDFSQNKDNQTLSAADQLSSLTPDKQGTILSEEDGYFVTAVTRSPTVYRGNPFQVEAGLLYARDLKSDDLAQMYRFANKVPLQYLASACVMTKTVMSVPWKTYGLNQARGALPTGPVVILTNIVSSWVPYTSESKEAIAHYPEIAKELRLALLECGRKLQKFLNRKRRRDDEEKKRSYIIKYMDPVGEALQEIIGFSEKEKTKTLNNLKNILQKTREEKQVKNITTKIAQ